MSNEHENLVTAARELLAARGEDMVTLVEWVALARAVAACTNTKTVFWLTEEDRETLREESEGEDGLARLHPIEWDPDVDGALGEGAAS